MLDTEKHYPFLLIDGICESTVKMMGGSQQEERLRTPIRENFLQV